MLLSILIGTIFGARLLAEGEGLRSVGAASVMLLGVAAGVSREEGLGIRGSQQASFPESVAATRRVACAWMRQTFQAN